MSSSLNQDARILRSGPFEMLYEKGFLRYISTGNEEVVRMMYFALRDENWATLDRTIEDEQVTVEADSFIIRYTCNQHKGDRVIFRWSVTLQGDTTGTIRFHLDGEALHDSLKNRAGFCVLHPIKESIGQPVEIVHPDGQMVKGNFPVLVAPDNPFKNIRSIRFEIARRWYELSFEGDVFETEDQRNWTDASFKTFCTPLDLPFPQPLKKGTTVKQTVTFKPVSTLASLVETDKHIHLTNTGRLLSRPHIGVASSLQPLTEQSVAVLREVKFSHYRVEVRFKSPDWVSDFSRECTQAVQLGFPLEVVLCLTADFKDELEAFAVLCQQNRITPRNLLLLHDDFFVTPQVVLDYLPFIRPQLTATAIGAGTQVNFTELNRNRFTPRDLDFVSYAMHPQEHAFDNRSLVETLEGQAHTLTSARALYPALSVHASPITLRKRFNPYAALAAHNVMSEEQRADARQPSAFLAAWTLGSIKKLMDAGASSLTYFQTAGDQGIVSSSGVPYPVYDALKLLLEQTTATLSVTSSKPLLVEAMAWEDGTWLLWNYTDETQHVVVGEKRITVAPHEVKTLIA